MRFLKTNFIARLINSYMVDSPQPVNISYLWNFGSLLGVCLILQILTGIFLAMHYQAHVDFAFNSTEHIMRDVNNGWAVRYTHANVASFFFIFVYAHIGRGLYYGSYRTPRVAVWTIGVIILVLMMAIAFLGRICLICKLIFIYLYLEMLFYFLFYFFLLTIIQFILTLYFWTLSVINRVIPGNMNPKFVWIIIFICFIVILFYIFNLIEYIEITPYIKQLNTYMNTNKGIYTYLILGMYLSKFIFLPSNYKKAKECLTNSHYSIDHYLMGLFPLVSVLFIFYRLKPFFSFLLMAYRCNKIILYDFELFSIFYLNNVTFIFTIYLLWSVYYKWQKAKIAWQTKPTFSMILNFLSVVYNIGLILLAFYLGLGFIGEIKICVSCWLSS